MKEEYDSQLKEFVPYQTYAYVVLNENNKIQSITGEEPAKCMESEYKKMIRHTAYNYLSTQTPVPHYEFIYI